MLNRCSARAPGSTPTSPAQEWDLRNSSGMTRDGSLKAARPKRKKVSLEEVRSSNCHACLLPLANLGMEANEMAAGLFGAAHVTGQHSTRRPRGPGNPFEKSKGVGPLREHFPTGQPPDTSWGSCLMWPLIRASVSKARFASKWLHFCFGLPWNLHTRGSTPHPYLRSA